MSKLKIVQSEDGSGFAWVIVTEKAKEIFNTGLFELFILNWDGSESKIEEFYQLSDALGNGNIIAIEGGNISPYKEII